MYDMSAACAAFKESFHKAMIEILDLDPQEASKRDLTRRVLAKAILDTVEKVPGAVFDLAGEAQVIRSAGYDPHYEPQGLSIADLLDLNDCEDED